MRLLGSTAVLTLGWFLVASAIGSAAAWIATHFLRRQAAKTGRAANAPVLLTVRLLPATLAVLVAIGLFLPVHWASEPRDGSESFGVLLPGLAVVSLLLIVARLVHVGGALRATRRLRRGWTRAGRPDATRIVDDRLMPGVSLSGVFRTTIVVGRPVREALTREELEVAVAHEIAHRRAWDNLKRFAMMVSPDLFGFTAAARWLEREWRTEVECRADAAAAAGDAARAATLASALLKVARLADTSGQRQARVAALCSTFHDQSVLELRVRRLVSGDAVAQPPSEASGAAVLVVAPTAVSAAWLLGLPRMLHLFSEVLVERLP